MKRIGILLALWAGAALPAAPLPAQTDTIPRTASADSLRPPGETFFVTRDAYVAGGFALATVALYPLDRFLAQEVQDSAVQAIDFARDAAQALSGGGSTWGWLLASGVLYGTGTVVGRRPLAETGLHSIEAILLGDAFTRLIKGVAGRARPLVGVDTPHDFALGRGFGDHDFQSFPSGHATASFAAASALTSEVSRHWPGATWIVGPGLYATATFVGLSRMYNNKHWASDVVIGAAIGTFSGLKVVRQNHNRPDNRVDRWLLSAIVLPDGRGGVVLTFRPSGQPFTGTRTPSPPTAW